MEGIGCDVAPRSRSRWWMSISRRRSAVTSSFANSPRMWKAMIRSQVHGSGSSSYALSSRKRCVSHGLQTEEASPVRLSAVEQEEGRRACEVVAQRIPDELTARLLEATPGRVQRLVALDLAEHYWRVPDQVETVVTARWLAGTTAAASRVGRCSRKCSPSASFSLRPG